MGSEMCIRDRAKGASAFLQDGLPVVAFFLGILMVSRIAYPHLLNKLLRGPRPVVTLVEVLVVGVLAVILHQFVLFLAFAIYALLGPILWLRGRLFRRAGGAARTSASEPPAGDPLF